MFSTLALVAAILILDACLAVATWVIVAVTWNNVVREELKVRGRLVWTFLVGIVVAITNAAPIAVLMLTLGKPTFASFFLTLIMDAILALLTWLFIEDVWNNVVREKLKVRRNFVRAFFVSIIVAIANAMAIAYLMQ